MIIKGVDMKKGKKLHEIIEKVMNSEGCNIRSLINIGFYVDGAKYSVVKCIVRSFSGLCCCCKECHIKELIKNNSRSFYKN